MALHRPKKWIFAVDLVRWLSSCEKVKIGAQ